MAEADRQAHGHAALCQTESLVATLKETEGRLFTMKLGFDNASQMMVSFSAALEATVSDARLIQTDQLVQIRELETQRCDQDRLVTELLAELEKERTRVSNTTDDDAMGHAIALLRAKQAENQAHAAVAARYRTMAATSDDDASGDALDRAGDDGRHDEEMRRLELPEGWETAESPEGLTYYIHHTSKTTAWAHPGFYTASSVPPTSPLSASVAAVQAATEIEPVINGKKSRRKSKGWRARLPSRKKSAVEDDPDIHHKPRPA